MTELFRSFVLHVRAQTLGVGP